MFLFHLARLVGHFILSKLYKMLNQVHDQNQEEDIREAFRVFDNVSNHHHHYHHHHHHLCDHVDFQMRS